MKAVSRLLTLALSALLLVPSVLSCVLPTVAADDAAETYTGGTPVYLVDFTDPTDNAGFSNLSALQTLSEDGYVSFRATANDPCTFLRQPTCAVADVRYAVIEYRTTVTDLLGQFYAGFAPGPGLSEATCITWDWNGDGEWNKKIVDISKYSETGADAFGGLRFDPLQQNNGKVVTDGDTLDVKCIAFFKTEAEAEGFTIAAYKQYLADQKQEEEDKKEEDEEVVRDSWQQPAYKEVDASILDNRPGTLKLTPSEDGATVTVSYTLNGEEKSYTVPNSNQYTSGPLAGVDDLGRTLYNQFNEVQIHETLPTKYQMKVIDADGGTQVGIFYFLWMGEHGDYGILDMEKIIAEAGEDKAGSTNTANWGPLYAMHHFAEPLFGYYYSSDEWVIRKHMELLSNAGVDFLYFDTTNARTYMHNVQKIMKVLHEMNEQGYDAPQICFYTHTNAAAVVRDVYDNIYSKNLYPDTWYYVGGKPLIMAPKTANIDDFFTVKQDLWPFEEAKENAWPWIDMTWDQRVFDDEDGRMISVSVAQQAGAGWFAASRLYGDRTNHGRSYNGRYQKRGDEYVYSASGNNRHLQNDPESYKYGYNLQSQFSRAYLAEADYVLVAGWNEWVAERQASNFSGLNLASDAVVFIDTCGVEFSRDIEMTRGYYFDNYYMQLIYNIQTLKGAAPTLPQDMRKTINITGTFDQWDDIPVTYHDPAGDAADRDSLSFGQVRLTDESGRNDIVASKMTVDKENLYIYIETANAIRKDAGDSTWMNVYLNVDNTQTGWYGYDYIINYERVDDFTTKVAKCTTTDGSYGFETVGDASIHVNDKQMMVAVPLSTLGITNYKEVYFTFKIADSDTKITTMEQFYTDGDVAPLGRTNFVFQNYIPGVSEPEPETDPVTEPVTEPITDPSDPMTEPPTTSVESEPPASADTDKPADKGCGSAIGTLSAVSVAVMAAGMALTKRDCRRKRED